MRVLARWAVLRFHPELSPIVVDGRHARTPMGEKEEVCVDCGDAKRSAEARAAVPVVDGSGQLQLGGCQPLYEAWTDCIAKKDNQATACAEVLKGFKACHASMSAGRLEAPAPSEHPRPSSLRSSLGLQ